MPLSSDASTSSAGQNHASARTSLSLLNRAAAGSDLAWQRLADLYGPLVFYWCRKGGLNPDDAGDVMQDVFTRITRGLHQFVDGDGDRSSGVAGSRSAGAQKAQSFRGWIRVITRNCLVDHYRRQSRLIRSAGGTEANLRLQNIPADFDREELTDSDRRAESQLTRRAIALIRNDFEPQTWTAFWRTVIDGVSTREVSLELGLSTASVRQAKSRVLRCLRNELGGDLPSRF